MPCFNMTIIIQIHVIDYSKLPGDVKVKSNVNVLNFFKFTNFSLGPSMALIPISLGNLSLEI